MTVKNQEQKEVYKTKIPPKNEETYQYLTGWRRPRTAYVLFETRELHLLRDGERRWGTGLMTLNVESRPEQMHQVDIYLNKGFRLLDYGNFPRHDDPNQTRAAKARHYSRGGAGNPWSELERFLLTKMGLDSEWREEKGRLEGELLTRDTEINDLKARVAQYEARLKKEQGNDGLYPQGAARKSSKGALGSGAEDKNPEPAPIPSSGA